MAAGMGSSGVDAADSVLPGVISYSVVFSACETGPTNVAGLGSLGIDAAYCHSAECHFSHSRHQCW